MKREIEKLAAPGRLTSIGYPLETVVKSVGTNRYFIAQSAMGLLSWRGRFAGILNAVNCFSSTEDVLANASANQPMFAGGVWKKQEMMKGTTVWNDLNLVTFGVFNIACEGGWGINAYYALDPTWYVYQYGFTGRPQTDLTRDDAVVHPLFTPFRSESANMHSTNLFTVADADYRYALRAKFLGDAIPAISFATGANPLADGIVTDNIPVVNSMCNTHRWPSERTDNGLRLWLHSDIKNLAYFYVYNLFDRIVGRSGGLE